MHLNSHVLTQNKPTLIIAAIASRPYVYAAVEAGFDVIALDCFADRDTTKIAKEVHQVPLKNGGLDGEYMLEVIRRLDKASVQGLCCGAGLEMQPALIGEIAQQVAVIGNAEEAVAYCKDPKRFFATCDALGILHPTVVFDLPESTDGWLQKTIGGSGGGHVKQIQVEQTALGHVYFQQYQAGQPISCLFLADANRVEVVGFHTQWTDFEVNASSYRYSGAATQVSISDLVKERLVRYVEELTQAIGLVGLNSCDVICDGDTVYVLEINPRLSASIDLYAKASPDLMAKHMAASRGELTALPEKSTALASHAHQVVYAEVDMAIKEGFSWPAWVVDVPEDSSAFQAGMPVCTVKGSANTAEQAKEIVRDRAMTISHTFLN